MTLVQLCQEYGLCIAGLILLATMIAACLCFTRLMKKIEKQEPEKSKARWYENYCKN